MSAHHGGGEEELSPLAGRVVEGLVAAGAGTAGLLKPDLGIAAIGAAPLVSEALSRAVAVVVRRRRRNVAEMLGEAVRKADLEEKQLLEHLVSTPARQELLATAVEAGARATLEEKIRALGQALARGAVGDEVAVDVELLLVSAIADLGPPHLRLLLPFSGNPRPISVPMEYLARVARVGAAIHPLIGVLQRHGIVEIDIELGIDQSEGVRITPFGLQVVTRLRAAGEALQ